MWKNKGEGNCSGSCDWANGEHLCSIVASDVRDNKFVVSC